MDLKDKFIGAFLGCGIGDAMGYPYEGFPRAKMLELGPVTGYKGRPPFRWSDDMALTNAVARAIVTWGYISIQDIRVEHVRTLETEGDRGWGGATTYGVRSIRMGIEPTGLHGSMGAAGNGPSIKASAVGLWHLRSPIEVLARDCWEIAQITHDDHRAGVGMMMQAEAVRTLAQLEPEQFDATAFLNHIIEKTSVFEGLYPHEVSFLPKLELVGKLLTSSVDEAAEKIGTDCYVIESLPFAIWCFLRNPFDILATVLEAVNAGGDADSTASMAGTQVGALIGATNIPQNLIGPLERDHEIRDLAQKLYGVWSSPPKRRPLSL